jgi:hypothetical protein
MAADRLSKAADLVHGLWVVRQEVERRRRVPEVLEQDRLA